MTYGYVRVSTCTQNIDRQLAEMYKYNLTDCQIFIDKQSGKDFNRESYLRLKKVLKENDLLIIKSIDRLGRNYDMIIKEWQSLTKEIKIDILIIDFPLLDTRNEENNLIGRFVSDIFLQVLSFVAQTERENIKKRQYEGIHIAKLKGVHLGRPKAISINEFKEALNKLNHHQMIMEDILLKFNISKSTFYKYKKLLSKENTC